MKSVLTLSLLAVLAGSIPSALAVEANPISPNSWTMILLPDTQHYVEDAARAAIFDAQTQWIADHKTSHNVKMVLHQGDVTNNNNAAQFNYAKHSMDILSAAGVPYSIAPGNHDYGTNGGTSTRDSLFNTTTYFGTGSAYATQPHFASGNGGFFEAGKTDNSYCTFNAGGEDWLVFSAEFGPRDAVVTWIDSVASAHPNHNVILNTHAYLFNDGSRYDWPIYGANQTWNPHSYAINTLPGGVNDGQELWDKLITKHENWKFTFNGHVLHSGTGWLGSHGDNGNVVQQLLANYQMRAEGGEGYLRILEFMDDGNTVKVSSYSPYLGSYLTTYDQDFTIKMNHLPPPPITGVSAAGFSVPTTTSDASSIWTIVGSGPGDVQTLSPANVADLSIQIGGVPLHRNKGVLLASVRQNSRNGFYGTVEVSQLNFFSLDKSTLQVATSRAYTSNEYNVDVSVGFFPFSDGWIAGHVRGDGALWEHNGVSADNIAQVGTGRYRLSIDGINSQEDGMLFVVGGENGHNNYSMAPLANGSGWEIAARDNTATTFGALENNPWSFVYIDYSSPDLTGGRIAADGGLIDARGSFALTQPSTGVYRITIDGYTPGDGILLLTASGWETEGGLTLPTDNIISYEADGNTFVVNTRDRDGSASPLQNGEFVFAFLAYDTQLIPALVPGDANYDGRVDDADSTLLARSWGLTEATWTMGDFDRDGVVGPKDAAILAANWGHVRGSASEASGTTVPEPGMIGLLGLGTMALLAVTRRCRASRVNR